MVHLTVCSYHVTHAFQSESTLSDPNLDNRIDKFKDLIIKKQVYKIPIQYLIDIGLVNFPESFSTRFIFTLENHYINHLNQMLKLLLYQNQTLRYIFMELLIFRTYKLNYMKTSKSISIHSKKPKSPKSRSSNNALLTIF